jgi:EAL domain-containing protein (putative c-di-GMP-specific phosphodiesterase class I)
VRVALDDFGTGFASLTHLLTVPVDLIKIDKSFIARLDADPASATIVEALLWIGARLGIGVVAEGIETECQVAQLRALGCSLGQGYFFSRPVPRDIITEMMLGRAEQARTAAVMPRIAISRV